MVKQPILYILNTKKMHLDISLEETVAPELSMDYLISYRLDNQQPPYMRYFQSFSSIEIKLWK